jgi:hypothetical protein
LRDYGWPAIAAFTIFNVGGAMAMGFWFKTRNEQQKFERKHKPAIALFSYVTIAYQLFFLAWLGAMLDQALILPITLAVGLVIYFTKGLITYWAIVFYILSLVLFIVFNNNNLAPLDLGAKQYWPHTVLPLAIGFIFSPYLDITFHRAYKNSKSPQLSFALGFGVLFLSLLTFVLLYASSLSDIFFNQVIPAAIIYPVVGFLVLQTAFTIAAHTSELKTQQYAKPSFLAGVIATMSAVSLTLISLFEGSSFFEINLPFEETIYKGFLFFYSLVFPLYLLLGKSKPYFLWVLAICTPAYALGFLIGDEYSLSLSIGVAILLSALALKYVTKSADRH